MIPHVSSPNPAQCAPQHEEAMTPVYPQLSSQSSALTHLAAVGWQQSGSAFPQVSTLAVAELQSACRHATAAVPVFPQLSTQPAASRQVAELA